VLVPAIPLSEYRADVSLGPSGMRAKHGDGFLVVEAESLGPTSSNDTGNIPVAAVKEALVLGSKALLVLPLKKYSTGPGSSFAFISIGRHEQNDVCLPHATVSRFHAFMRSTSTGWEVVDGRSQHGTWLAGQRVPAQGDGSPVHVPIGSTVRFGELRVVLFNAASLFAAVQAR